MYLFSHACFTHLAQLLTCDSNVSYVTELLNDIRIVSVTNTPNPLTVTR